MTALNTIFDDNWDAGITTKPSFITISETNWRGYQRVVATQKLSVFDNIVGTTSREYYDPDSHDVYSCIATSMTSETDVLNMVKAIKKVCATFSPTSAENVLQWTGGDLQPFNGVRWIFRFTVLKRKSGIRAY